MRKVIKGAMATVGILLAFIGLVACMCETPDTGMQLRTMATGSALLAVGAITACLAFGADQERNSYGEIR